MMDTRRPVVDRDQQTRRLKEHVDKKNDDASKGWVSDQAVELEDGRTPKFS